MSSFFLSSFCAAYCTLSAATTQGESIEWQTKELTATILRDDTAEHNWCHYAIFDTETNAVSYIKGLLSITGGVSA